MNFVRGPIKTRFYLAANGISTNGHSTIWFLAVSPTTNQVYLSSRPEDKARGLQFSRVSVVGGYILSCFQGQDLFYLGSIGSKQGFGPTTLGLTSRSQAFVFSFNRPFNLNELLSGASYTLTTTNTVETILGTADNDTQSIGYYSSSTNGLYSTGIRHLGDMSFFTQLQFFPIPVRVYPAPTDGLSCLFLFLSGQTIRVYTTQEDADVDRFYNYCTDSNVCGSCYGICSDNLLCLNTTDGIECGNRPVSSLPVKTLTVTPLLIVIVVGVLVAISIVILLASLGHRETTTQIVHVKNR